ncbi:hypothetical protein O3M35_005506 [Rhynocoris fuscipes]|uniref:H15 domain-containing protein n=1 Tax=Rhynocoris fuscipes TaxID=488301 RepID=A0AAW1DKL4_9HEMI
MIDLVSEALNFDTSAHGLHFVELLHHVSKSENVPWSKAISRLIEAIDIGQNLGYIQKLSNKNYVLTGDIRSLCGICGGKKKRDKVDHVKKKKRRSDCGKKRQKRRSKCGVGDEGEDEASVVGRGGERYTYAVEGGREGVASMAGRGGEGEAVEEGNHTGQCLIPTLVMIQIKSQTKAVQSLINPPP